MPKLMIKRKSLVVQYEIDGAAEGPPMKRRHSCAECRKEFRSAKALHGHLRVHPTKGYRGVTKPTKKPPIKESDPDVITAAEIIMMMIEHDGENSKASSSRPAFHCSACNRSFDTHQALGGHMASHNKHKKTSSEAANEEDVVGPVQPRNGAAPAREDAVHECDVCGKTFDKGVSLGGHKRKHFLERERAKESGNIEAPSAVPTPASTAPSSSTNSRPFYLDLNVVPDVEDESGN